METQAAKTVNNALAVLSVLLKKAIEWAIIDRMPCTIRLLRAPNPAPCRYHQMTSALREHRHLRSARVLCQSDGTSFTRIQAERETLSQAVLPKSPLGDASRTCAAGDVLRRALWLAAPPTADFPNASRRVERVVPGVRIGLQIAAEARQ